ncbi:hypothetical protein DICPUDRAFT_147431 [Dictyostelium purpureum]|uniref:VPS9 domain-containing protein n=1 Tax=Dictyostelium purpureum TaxID=5786 RepID=F0Z8G6_DICPU|nr:uncharacterized protein DICPUDRAFT_147431 [Dictyostelium purpureum]EGC39723.1 hypothetical protein DICPUDRAFT_147431 [Dictyostelium purpureum]|eukprot:XP_003283709.1 hypothetical protein DICPUDRAFT_147431 [Dictyostelium purpureum]
MDEDLNLNIFFKTIKTKYTKIFNLIESKCYTLCIPQFSSLYGMNFTQKIVESHVFIESKYYQSEYETLNKDTHYIIDNGYIIDKNNSSKKVKILFDELCYNKDFKSYRLICIEEPLVGSTGVKPSISFSQSDMDLIGHHFFIPKPQKPTFTQSKDFFLLDKGLTTITTIVLNKANKQLEDFEMNNSILCKESVENVRRSLLLIHEKVLDDLVCANAEYKQLQTNEKQMNNLSMLLESYIMGKLQNKIYEELKIIYEKEDSQLYEKMLYLSKQSLGEIGIKQEFEAHLIKAKEVMLSFSSDLPTTSSEIDEIASPVTSSTITLSSSVPSPSVTPLDKLLTIIQASKEIEESIKMRTLLECVDEDNVLTITGDDALPLTAYLLIQARPKHLISDLMYCSKFIFTEIFNSSMGYHLINLTAAVDYIKRFDILSDKTITYNASINYNSTENLVSVNSISINSNAMSSPPYQSQSNNNNKNSNSNNSNESDEAALYNNLKKISITNNNNNQFTSTPNLFNSLPNTTKNDKYSTISISTKNIAGIHGTTTTINNNITTIDNNYKYSKAPTVISLNDEDDLGDFIGRLRELKDDVIVASEFK